MLSSSAPVGPQRKEVEMRFLLPVLSLVLLSGWSDAYAGKKKSNLPVSKEASLFEVYSSSEWTIKATGIGKKNKDAEADARKAALYFVLFGGTDPILRTEEDRRKFEPIQEQMFEPSNVAKYISWEARGYLDRRRTSDKKVKLTKLIRINVKMLKEDLAAKGIIKLARDLAQEVGLPMIMVIPEVPKGENPIEHLSSDPMAKHAARVIESYLTARQYEVVVPEQMEALQALSEAQESLKGFEEDYSYQLALSIGSDVYITYSTDIKTRTIGSSTVRKAIVSVRAYETTTARLLGTETGYSVERPSPEEAVLEEAINDAVDKVLSRINAYWNEDLKRGVQYKLIVRIGEDFDEDEVEDISFAISDLIDRFCNYSKENVVTESTLDYLVWAKMDKFEKSSKLYRAMRKAFPQEFEDGKLRRININRKLILLKVVRAE